MSDKNSFILYTEYFDKLALLTDEQFGKLMRALFLHEKGEAVPDMEFALELAYGFIVGQLDRDRDKYEGERKKRSDAGKKGGKASGKSRREKAEATVQPSYEIEANEASASSASKYEANEADNVDVDVNENVDETVDDSVVCASHTSACTREAPPQPPQENIVISLPLRDGSVYDLTQEDLDHLDELYPRVDVLSSLKKYQSWLMDDPGRTPGTRMMPERIKEWLAQEKSALKPRGQPPISDDERDEIDKALQTALGDPWRDTG